MENLTRLLPSLNNFDQLEALLATLNRTAQNVSGENDRMREAALRLEALESLLQVSCACALIAGSSNVGGEGGRSYLVTFLMNKNS